MAVMVACRQREGKAVELLVLIAILQTLCGVTAAVFADDRGRSPLKWYLLSFLLGPVAVALVLSRHVQHGDSSVGSAVAGTPAATPPPAQGAGAAPFRAPQAPVRPIRDAGPPGRAHSPLLAFLGGVRDVVVNLLPLAIVLAVVALGALEAVERWRMHSQTAALIAWEKSADGYLRAAGAGGVGVQSQQAVDVVTLFSTRLRAESAELDRQLAIALQGQRESYGIEAILRNVPRLLTLRSPRYPAVSALPPDDQLERVESLRALLARYRLQVAAMERVVPGVTTAGATAP